MKIFLRYSAITISLVIFIAVTFNKGTDQAINNEIQQIENQIALDAIEQYKIAKKNNAKMDAYIQAGIIAAAFLQAKDEKNYKKWKSIENEEAKNVGLK